MDDSGQTSAEYILLFGGIMVVVLLVVYMYRNYVADLSGEIESGEVKEFNSRLQNISRLFEQFIFCCNHQSNKDILVLGTRIIRRRFKSMAKEELFKNKLVGAVLKGLGGLLLCTSHTMKLKSREVK